MKWGIPAKIFGHRFAHQQPAADEPEKIAAETEMRIETLRLGDIVRVKGCEARPQLVGAVGEIVQLQSQEFEKYSVRPVWVRITSGDGQGTTCGFWEHEVEPVNDGNRQH